MRVLVTGATGYIGGRLVARLLDAGHQVSVLVRDAKRIESREWSDTVTVFEGDLQNADTLLAPLANVDAAYYLVHSMYAGEDFAELDRRAANNFVAAAKNLKHVVYLGGLLPDQDSVEGHSEHLDSRAEVGQILRESLPTTELRAGPIIGSGSASFEMVRYLTERLPAMIAPKWIMNEVQPIAIRDVIAYLVQTLGRDDTLGVIDIGVDQPMTFKQMMEDYGAIRGFTRVILPVPVLAPALAARWVGFITPIPNSLAVPLVEGVVEPVTGDLARAHELFPDIHPIPYKMAVELALEKTVADHVETRWSGALGSAATYEMEDKEGVVSEVRTRFVKASPEKVYRSFSSLGGEKGWLVWNWAWQFRGMIDGLIGGPGLRRGRRHPTDVFPGEAIDFWRVEEARPPELLRLQAEMKVPGHAWLQWESLPENGGTRLVQTALFEPIGFWGAAYWYGIYPLHKKIFSDLVDAVVRDAEES